MSSYRRARREERARQFGRRHPCLALIIAAVIMAGAVAVCAVQIGHGSYLGSGWLIAAAAGMATAAALTALRGRRARRHAPAPGRLEVAWAVLAVLSAFSMPLPFPLGRYGSVQAFFNVVHAVLLGYGAVTYTALLGLFAFLLVHRRGLPGPAEPRQPPGPGLADEIGQLHPRRSTLVHGWPGWVLAGALAGLVAGVFLAVAAEPRSNGAASTAAGGLIVTALAAACVAVAAAAYRLYRRYRSRRLAAVPPGLRGTRPGDLRWQDPES